MKRIVREHYPIERLPEDLQKLLDASLPVTLVLEQAAVLHDLGKSSHAFQDKIRDPGYDMPLTRIAEQMQSRRASSTDPVGRLRGIREEWDRRDELHERIRADDAG